MKIKYYRSVSFLAKGILGYLAYVAIYPSFLSPWLNKLRGVNIKNIYNVYIAANVLIDTIHPELVTIEDDVYITRGVKILTHFNPTPPQKKIIRRDSILGEVHIKSGAFLGVSSIILPNVTIGENAIIGAGSVVTKDVPPNGIVCGNPAKLIGNISEHPWDNS